MIHTKFTRITRQATLLASTILFFASNASGFTGDPFSFCTNSCKSPGPCSNDTLKSQCKKVCSSDHMWKQAAKLQMSSSSKEFRMEKDANKKNDMLYSSPLAQCLELKPKDKEKEELKPKEEEPTPPPPAPVAPPPPPVPAPMKVTAPKEDLCAAAVKKAMADLEGNQTALDHGKIILESQKHELAAALKAHQATSSGG